LDEQHKDGRENKGPGGNMKYPRFKRYSLIALTILFAVIVVAKCLPTQIQANPITGPPTIEQHLAGINASLSFFKWAGGVISGLVTLLIGTMGYAYKKDIVRLDKKAQVAIDLTVKLDEKYDSKIDHIETNFMSIPTHDRICPGKKGN
jgi:hypothetical protein